ncbi:tyrosine-type recombinase/integrase [Roseibium salinum]|nr:tyrosine-type recombinase/integrase [Roseibium salinum]
MASLRKRNGKWQAQVRRAGLKPRAQSFISKADAQRWIRQTEQELDRTALACDPTQLENTTVADLIVRYRREVTPSKRGAASEDKRLEVFLRYQWAKLPLSKATPQVFSRHRDIRAQEVSPGTIIREMGLLRAVFETARREWDIPLPENPLAKVKKPRAPQGRQRRLNGEELEWVLEAAQDTRNDWLIPCILLAVDTGMRRGELLNIRVRDLNLADALLTIPETKTGYARCIPLTERAVTLLRKRISAGSRPDDLLFPVTPNAFRLAWEHCKKRAARLHPDIKSLRFSRSAARSYQPVL